MIWVVLLAAVLVDIVATSILTYYLRKSRTGFKRSVAISGLRLHILMAKAFTCRTDSIVDVLMVYAINTGMWWKVLQ